MMTIRLWGDDGEWMGTEVPWTIQWVVASGMELVRQRLHHNLRPRVESDGGKFCIPTNQCTVWVHLGYYPMFLSWIIVYICGDRKKKYIYINIYVYLYYLFSFTWSLYFIHRIRQLLGRGPQKWSQQNQRTHSDQTLNSHWSELQTFSVIISRSARLIISTVRLVFLLGPSVPDPSIAHLCFFLSFSFVLSFEIFFLLLNPSVSVSFFFLLYPDLIF